MDTNILPQMHWTLNIFGPSATTVGGFGVSLNYSILNFKKSVCLKNVWMRHYMLLKNKIKILINKVDVNVNFSQEDGRWPY